MGEVLKVEGVTKRFGGLVAVDNASFSINEGEILGLIGPNGAGKTTLFNVIVALHRADSGRILFRGGEIQHLNTHEIAARGITKTFQITALFNDMSILDNVIVGAFLHHKKFDGALEAAEAALRMVGLSPGSAATTAELNLIDSAHLEIARALATRPKLLLLDEVMAGLVPKEVDKALDMIRKIRDRGVTVMFIEHNMRAVMRISSRIIAFDSGKIIAEGTPEEVCNNPRVIESYLGKGYVHVAN